MRLRLICAVLILLALIAAGCGGDDDDGAATPTATPAGEPDPTAAPEPEPTEEPTVEPTEEPTEEPTAEPTEEPTAEPTEEPTAEPTPGSPLPGEPFDLFVPTTTEVVGVIGVAFDDILEVHEAPGENSPLTGTLPNLADDVLGTGEGRRLPNSIWWRIVWNDVEGWVGSGFMARLGATVDLTAEVVARNGGVIPGAETMLDLGTIVADLVKSDEPGSRVVVSVAPTVGDLGEITMDVVGLGDDALSGYRLHIFADPDPSGEGFGLSNVEARLFCGRAVSEDGLCV